MKCSTSTSSSILQNGRVKPGIYKIRNIVSGTYVDIKDHVRELCGRHFNTLESSRGQWEILPFGQGYTIQKAGPVVAGQREQFCIMLEGLTNGSVVSVSSFPGAWMITVVEDEKYSGLEYVRISWGPTNMVWDLAQWGSDRDGTRVEVMDNSKFAACRIWELIPATLDNFTHQPSSSFVARGDPGAAPPYEERTGNRCCTCSHVTTAPADDGYGTTVIEVTTVITRKKYRVED